MMSTLASFSNILFATDKIGNKLHIYIYAYTYIYTNMHTYTIWPIHLIQNSIHTHYDAISNL